MAAPDNVVVQHLRAIREQLDTSRERALELMQPVGNPKVQVTQVANLATQMANQLVQIDTIDARVDGVKRRLLSRFRSSHHFAAPSFANFGIKGH